MDFSGIKKNCALGFLVLGLVLSGCTKKETKKDVDKKTSKMAYGSQIPVLNEEGEDFFNNEEISEFAFLDDEDKKEEGVKDLFGIEKDGSTLAESEEDKDFCKEDAEDSFFAWEEDEQSAKQEEASLKTVYFDLNKNNIRNDQRESLKTDIEQAKKIVADGKDVIIRGNTCELGAPSFNIPLSERRANAIKHEMVKNGIPEEKIKAVGLGSEAPVVWTDKTDRKGMIEDLAPNRRAEVVVG